MFKKWCCWALLMLPFLVIGCADLSSIVDAIQPVPEPASIPETIRPTPALIKVEVTATPAVSVIEDAPLLFVSNRGNLSTTDIYQINADGSGLVRLTNNPASERDPVWSPDREQIAFTSDRTGTSQIFLMSMDNYEIEQLTDHPEGALSPTWSPDGTEIAFVEPKADSKVILTIPTQAEGKSSSISVDIVGPANLAWSPLGDKIAFSALVDGQVNERDIFTYDLNKELLINLTNESGIDDNPAWSSDGNMIAFQTNRDGNENIYTMRANGALQTPLTTDPKADIEPDWSSDGRLILFSSNREGHFNMVTTKPLLSWA